MKLRLLILLLLSVPALAAPSSETMAERNLRLLVERQNLLMNQADPASPHFDIEQFKSQVQKLSQSYEAFLADNPDFAAGFAAYGLLLSKVGMDRESAVMLLKANQIDADIPLVKNQLGNYLAEHAQPLDAVNYYLAAIKLAPNEPLYHYQLGTLLHEARDEFLKSGEWTTDSVDAAMHDAFRQAAELAPDRIEFTYRYAESFYDLPKPDWEAALKVWASLEEKARSAVERETMRLHAANVCLKMGKVDHARLLLSSVDDPALAAQKQKLVAQLPVEGDK